jgi:hypothetical protein
MDLIENHHLETFHLEFIIRGAAVLHHDCYALRDAYNLHDVVLASHL